MSVVHAASMSSANAGRLPALLWKVTVVRAREGHGAVEDEPRMLRVVAMT